MLYKWCVLCIPIGSSVEKTLCYLSLGTSTRIEVWKERRRRRKWNSVGWSVHPGCAPHNTYNICSIWDSEKEKPTNETNGRPSHLSTWYCRYVVFLSHVKTTELLPPASARKPICCHQSIKPNQSTAIWWTNELGFDQYGILKDIDNVRKKKNQSSDTQTVWLLVYYSALAV